MPGSSSSRIATILVVIPLLALVWFLAPLALPVWRWRNMDFEELAKKTQIPVKELQQEYKVIARYEPRSDTDPCPWQLIQMDPPWSSTNDKHTDEDHLLVRCTFVSDRDGTGPSKLFLGSGGPAAYKDRYWKAICWRFPNGSFGFNHYRPVLIYRGDSLEKCDLSTSEPLATEIGGSFGGPRYRSDDKEIDDGVHSTH
jgi:hypothetical protein